MEYENASSQTILKRVISKGGLLGACADMYIQDEDKAKQFISELSQMCEKQDYTNYFGKDLITEIHRFASGKIS
jgi:hypothetical protein